MLKFSVADMGTGIAKEDLPKLFKQFSQVDQVPSRSCGGTGLGLSISKRLVEMVGGRIWGMLFFYPFTFFSSSFVFVLSPSFVSFILSYSADFAQPSFSLQQRVR